MNPFLRMFIQGTPQVLRAVQGFGAKAAPAVRAVADTVTNPRTYQALAGQAERVLQRPLPQPFAGANFGNIPARFTGMITDLTNMPAGRGQVARTGMVNRAIQEAAGFAPSLSRGVTQTAEGALRAPVIGDALRAGQSILTNPLQTAIQTGGQFARDPALRRDFLRQFGGTSEKAAKALAGPTSIGQVGGLLRNLSTAAAPFLKPSSVFNSIPGFGAMPGWAQSLVVPTSAAGAILGLTQLQGSTPQVEDDPYGNWQSLRYKSREDMMQQVNRQAQEENRMRAFGARQGPFTTFNVLSGDNLGTGGSSVPPPAPSLGLLPGTGQQAGQLTPPASSLTPRVSPGIVSTGAGVPAQRQNVQERALSQEVLNAAQQYAAPASVPLSSFYAGQQQLGRSALKSGDLLNQLQTLGGAAGMTPEALKQWAQQNPGLAYREMLRLQGRNQ